jgi:hypothetical protein
LREVVLTNHELLMAAQIGSVRQIASIKASLRDRHGFDGETGWQVHIEGAAGELAVAKLLGCFWDGSVNTFKQADIGSDLHVRTRSKHTYELIVRDNDPDGGTYVLVTGFNGRYVVHGCILGGAAKQPEWRKAHGDRPPAYFVPHSALADDLWRKSA